MLVGALVGAVIALAPGAQGAQEPMCRPTPYDHRAAVKLSGDVVAELEAVIAALG